MFKKILTVAFVLTLTLPVLADNTMESTISSDARITKDFAPDTVKIRFYVENSGMNINDIKQKNDKIVNDAISKLKSKLNSNEKISTIAYNINSIYSYKDKVRIFQKYEVKNGFEVKLKDLNKISDIIKIATDTGVNRVDNLNFFIEDGEKVCNDLLVQASKTAKSRAELIASSVGSSLLKPKSINPYCNLNNTVSRAYSNKMITMDAVAESGGTMPVIEAGSINVSASVNMTYYLK